MVPLLPPGSYKVEATRSGFKTATIEQVRVSITETATLNFKMQVGAINEVISVEAEPMQLDIESSTLGHITDQRMVEGLPLVSRNYTQILGLSPGVSGDVTNSAHIGRGDSSLSSGPGGYSIGGNSTNDPLLKYIPLSSETAFTNWDQAQIMRDWFSLLPGSPARGVAPPGSRCGWPP